MVSVKKNWSSGANIGLWVTFLIEDVALVDESKGPFTPEGVDLLDKVLHVLGLLLLYPQKADTGVEARILRRASPNLPLLSANVWLRVLELSHATWHTWSAVVTFVMYIGPEIKTFADYLSEDIYSPFTPDDSTLRRHGRAAVYGTQTFMLLVYISSTTSTKRPLTSPFLLNGGIPALMNLLKMFITRPKMLQPTPNDPMGFHRTALAPLVHGALLAVDLSVSVMWMSQARKLQV
ncbi:hypothetical protein MPER_04885 [Moniliophthora perniciosa FA553]|nr:hypothetical protein MPER_04885 [Moniliophthora perniciosa FA553]